MWRTFLILFDPIFEIYDFQFTYSKKPAKRHTALNPTPLMLEIKSYFCLSFGLFWTIFYNCFVKFFIKITRLPDTQNIWIYKAHLEFHIMKECCFLKITNTNFEFSTTFLRILNYNPTRFVGLCSLPSSPRPSICIIAINTNLFEDTKFTRYETAFHYSLIKTMLFSF